MFVDVDENLKREREREREISARDSKTNEETQIRLYTSTRTLKVVKETKSRLFFPLKG